MTTVMRNIAFYSIQLKRGDNIINPQVIFEMLDYIFQQLDCNQRTYDFAQDKNCVLDGLNPALNNTARELVIVSGKVNYRPMLRKFQAVSPDMPSPNPSLSPITRDNPKDQDEAEEEKTHVLMKIHGDEIVVLYETRRCFAFSHFISYLRNYCTVYHAQTGITQNYDYIEQNLIPRGDFLSLLDDLGRVVAGEVYISRSILGSDSMNYSERIEDVKETIVLNISAKRARDIKNLIRDIYNNFVAEGTQIRRIRLEGKNDNNNPIKLDTDYCQMKDWLEVELHPITQSIINPDRLFLAMQQMIERISME
ncbi:hypothetical protein LJC31_00725 [Synergistaceae bacterium OttesenSCG-928-I11]|nr:hypothetical protein [Synergistaceae bacterium OttesenSCG-928-I11]